VLCSATTRLIFCFADILASRGQLALGGLIFWLRRFIVLLHTAFNFIGQCEECLLDVSGILCRGFDEFDAERVCQLLSLFKCHCPIGITVTFITNQQLYNCLIGILLNLCQPILDILKALFVCDVVDQDDAMCALVLRAGDGLEALLACCVPDL